MDCPHNFWDWSTRDSYDWTNFLVGVIGFLLGGVGLFFTYLQAAGAKAAAEAARDAAQEAKQAVWKRTASADFDRLAGIAAQLAYFVQFRQRPQASVFNGWLASEFAKESKRYKTEIQLAVEDADRKIKEIEDDLAILPPWLGDNASWDNYSRELTNTTARLSKALGGLVGDLHKSEGN
jgi:hypothetical protein